MTLDSSMYLLQVDGLTLDQVKNICSGILAAQTPAVRSCTAGKTLTLPLGEVEMRSPKKEINA